MIKANAYISPTQRKKALKRAGYQTRVPKVSGTHRCDNCRHHGKARNFASQTTYDLHCKLFDTGVKTHGTCSKHASAAKAGAK